MSLTRRNFMVSGAIFALAGCVSSTPAPQTAVVRPIRSANPPGFLDWVDRFKAKARASGLPEPVLRNAFQNVGYLPAVIERDRNQTEVRRSTEDYLNIAASDERVANGKSALRQYAALFSKLETRFGVEKEIIAAIWGMESRFGKRRGEYPVISTLSTLSFVGRRRDFFESQLMAALRILRNGDITAQKMTGSWAGAMGHTQFIPTSFSGFAIDFNGDGRRDIWSDDPTDALASTANYLRRSGWRTGQPWGREITVPGQTGGGRVITTPGPDFTVFHNFNVLKRYNNATKYALGIGHLADRLAGAGPLKTQFPPDQYGLVLSDRKRLQKRLSALGYDIGSVDGVIGPKTTTAISAFQKSKGLQITGLPSKSLLALL